MKSLAVSESAIAMEKRPVDLKSLICSSLNFADLKSLRQVSRSWTLAPAEVLFKELVITQATLQQLEILSQWARIIVFRAYLLPSILPELWHEANENIPWKDRRLSVEAVSRKCELVRTPVLRIVAFRRYISWLCSDLKVH